MEYMDLLPPIVPSLVFARETCTPYCNCQWTICPVIGRRPGFRPTFHQRGVNNNNIIHVKLSTCQHFGNDYVLREQIMLRICCLGGDNQGGLLTPRLYEFVLFFGNLDCVATSRFFLRPLFILKNQPFRAGRLFYNVFSWRLLCSFVRSWITLSILFHPSLSCRVRQALYTLTLFFSSYISWTPSSDWRFLFWDLLSHFALMKQ